MSHAYAIKEETEQSDVVDAKPSDRAKALTTDALAALTAALEAGGSAALRDYLKVAARFHKYSFRNQALIAWQRPTATQVAGFHAWIALGRAVQKGEKGIAILAPMVGKDKKAVVPAGELAPVKMFGFRTVFVFDVAQTAGKDLPTIEIQPDGDDAGANGGMGQRLIDYAVGAGIVVQLADKATLGSAEARTTGTVIELGDWLTGAARAASLAHELAHCLLHCAGPVFLDMGKPDDRALRELEAESVAYVLSHAAGFTRLDRMSDYVVNWKGTAGRLESSLHRINAAVKILYPVAFPA